MAALLLLLYGFSADIRARQYLHGPAGALIAASNGGHKSFGFRRTERLSCELTN
jgi:hypothetical protein